MHSNARKGGSVPFREASINQHSQTTRKAWYHTDNHLPRLPPDIRLDESAHSIDTKTTISCIQPFPTWFPHAHLRSLRLTHALGPLKFKLTIPH
ncbi:unnamed protein product [Protopolystoma xenopodis]|uniref:Uncharacterized protein n=1 Tax=Protopolystoma xenopodis TaxID=117903 RepID=A0A448WTT1_9PLAT|nr:unnamed protein product [Protopolystoma xenopodis]